MSTLPIPGYAYKVGGGLEGNAPSYVVRQADQEFYAALKAAEFCYVFNSRQMGKSSLQNRTAQRLRAEGIACGVVNLNFMETHNATVAGWYQGIIGRLKSSLGIKIQHRAWWNEREDIPPLQRFVEFIETVLLVEISQPIVLFFDEIDSVLKFDFKDDFFALIRAFYEQRIEQMEYSRLTFALLGVATPSDLIQDRNRTPFNIGRAINLEGFQLHEVQPLIPGLVGKAENPEAVLNVILAWTDGQPFLVQKLCQLVLSSPDSIVAGDEAAAIEQLVRSRILENWEAQDNPEHLKTIRDRLLEGGELRAGRRLGLCRQIVQQEEIPANNSPEQTQLRLTGLVVKRQGRLQIYNRIYMGVFNLSWFDQELEKLRPYADGFNAWVASKYQDESRLLRGQVLQNARAWAEGKSLGDDDRRFLDASQELEKRDIQKKLTAEAEAKQVLAEANRKANQRLRVGAVALGLMLVGAAGAGWVATQSLSNAEQLAKKEHELRKKVSSLEEKEISLQKQFETVNVKRINAENAKKTAEQNLAEAKKQEEIIRQQYQQTQQQLVQVNQAKEKAIQETAQAKLHAQEAIQTAKSARTQAEAAKKDRERAKYELAQVNKQLESLKPSLRKALTLLTDFGAIDSTTGLVNRKLDDIFKLLQTSAQGIGVSNIPRIEKPSINTQETQEAAKKINEDVAYAVKFLNALFNFDLNVPPVRILDKNFLNAFWDGQQYNAPPQIQYLPDVTYHQIALPFIYKTVEFEVYGQPASLKESYADIFASLIKQTRLQQTAQTADWLFAPGGNAWILNQDILNFKDQSAFRSLKAPGTAYDHPALGKDPQVAHFKDLYTGSSDNGGVHINSGIPNKAFYETAIRIGSDKAGQIWYKALLKLNPNSQFRDAAMSTYQVAGTLYGNDSTEQRAVKTAWEMVGISLF